ncbi:hypothetical protein Salat_2685800 [Sesamum alatum]|uniref:Uncharacterized protein n=1 Tax=Sesamum alatum TaxID=300844 RepID=A0AAE1XQG9_9LAMI|nr:hypothetical protein Salat_2685800 [Sesamum alatum]
MTLGRPNAPTAQQPLAMDGPELHTRSAHLRIRPTHYPTREPTLLKPLPNPNLVCNPSFSLLHSSEFSLSLSRLEEMPPWLPPSGVFRGHRKTTPPPPHLSKPPSPFSINGPLTLCG